MRPIKYDYINGPMTVQWIPKDILVGKIRCHADEKIMPGPTRYSALIEVEPSGEYELTMVKKDSDAMEGPTMGEHSIVRRYLSSLGFYGLWRRAKRGTVKVVVNERGVLPTTLKLEKVKMENCDFVFKATVTGVSGKVKAIYTVELPDLDQVGLADVQNKVLVQGVAGSLGALATDYAIPAAPAL